MKWATALSFALGLSLLGVALVATCDRAPRPPCVKWRSEMLFVPLIIGSTTHLIPQTRLVCELYGARAASPDGGDGG